MRTFESNKLARYISNIRSTGSISAASLFAISSLSLILGCNKIDANKTSGQSSEPSVRSDHLLRIGKWDATRFIHGSRVRVDFVRFKSFRKNRRFWNSKINGYDLEQLLTVYGLLWTDKIDRIMLVRRGYAGHTSELIWILWFDQDVDGDGYELLHPGQPRRAFTSKPLLGHPGLALRSKQYYILRPTKRTAVVTFNKWGSAHDTMLFDIQHPKIKSNCAELSRELLKIIESTEYDYTMVKVLDTAYCEGPRFGIQSLESWLPEAVEIESSLYPVPVFEWVLREVPSYQLRFDRNDTEWAAFAFGLSCREKYTKHRIDLLAENADVAKRAAMRATSLLDNLPTGFIFKGGERSAQKKYEPVVLKDDKFSVHAEQNRVVFKSTYTPA